MSPHQSLAITVLAASTSHKALVTVQDDLALLLLSICIYEPDRAVFLGTSDMDENTVTQWARNRTHQTPRHLKVLAFKSERDSLVTPWQAFFLRKAWVMQAALSHGYSAALHMDADTLLLAPLPPEMFSGTHALGLSAHNITRRQEVPFGRFNAGTVLVRETAILSRWMEFANAGVNGSLPSPSKCKFRFNGGWTADQCALDAMAFAHNGSYTLLPIGWNYGWYHSVSPPNTDTPITQLQPLPCGLATPTLTLRAGTILWARTTSEVAPRLQMSSRALAAGVGLLP